MWILTSVEGRSHAGYAAKLAHGRATALSKARMRRAPKRRTSAYLPPAHPRRRSRGICVRAMRRWIRERTGTHPARVCAASSKGYVFFLHPSPLSFRVPCPLLTLPLALFRGLKRSLFHPLTRERLTNTILMPSDLQLASSSRTPLTFTIRTSARIALFIVITNIAFFVAFPSCHPRCTLCNRPAMLRTAISALRCCIIT